MEKYLRSFLQYGKETLSLSVEDLPQIKRCDHAMICWLSNVKIEQKHSTEDLRRINVHHIEDVLRWNRLRLSGHLYWQEETSWTKKIISFNVDGPTSWRRPKLRSKDVVIYARKTWISVWLVTDLNGEMPSDQIHSKTALQSTMIRTRRWNNQ